MRYCCIALTLGLSATSCEYNRVPPSPDEFPEESVMDAIAESLCLRFAECGCDHYATGQGGELSCEESAYALAETWTEAAREADLVYNGQCMTRLLDRRCDSVRVCQIYFGTVSDGEPCTAVGRLMSTCNRWSLCGADGKCHPNVLGPQRTGQEGDRCGTPLGDYDTPCADGLACLDGRCVVAAQLGAGCDTETPCGDGGWCSEGTCITVLAPGEPCSADDTCASKICHEGRCAEEQPPVCVGFSW